MQFLRQRTHEGMDRATARIDERARQQIDRELALIEKLDLPGYFLIVWDIVRFCREQNILVQGRGSAANSAVCYALGITAVDPVGMDLLFERFLSEERGEWPDIDLDLPSGDQRERAIQYVYERYGKLGAAMTANVITYRGRSAAREIGKAAVLRSGNARSPVRAGGRLGIQGSQATRSRANSATRASISSTGASANFSSFARRCRICRAIWGSTPAEWWCARDNSIPSCRSSRPRCPGASSCNGTRKIAPTWAS